MFDLSYFLSVQENRWKEWEMLVKAAQIEGCGKIQVERFNFEGGGGLSVSTSVGKKRIRHIFGKEEWHVTPFRDLPLETQSWVVRFIVTKTPRDKKSRGVSWEEKLFGLIDARGYISPDGKVLRFMWGEEGPFQALSNGSEFGWSLGDAAPQWARGRSV